MAMTDALARRLEGFPLFRRELEQLLPELGAEEGEYLQLLCMGLTVHDLVSFSPGELLGEVRTALTARRELPWGASVPGALFRDYILPFRINNEHPDLSRPWLYGQLRDVVRGMTDLQAALAVNCWCYAQATYTPADDRTMAPRGMCRRGKGRCGEESTLAAAALRAVCIPARQVYAPRWAHCDDNHAWVEFWAAGQWHYLGACEPEEVPDRGWFTAAASRAMLIRARVPDLAGGCRVENVTGRYAQTARLTLRVERQGVPQPGVEVAFQLVNDSRLCTIHRERTDAGGRVSLDLGLGSLTASAFFGGRLVESRVDLAGDTAAVLEWSAGFSPLTQERQEQWTQTPPRGSVPPPAAAHSPEFTAVLRRCDLARREKAARCPAHSPRWLTLCGDNRGEIEKFLAMPEFSPEDKAALLDTLRDKDFADVRAETLADALLCALPWKGKYPPLVWVKWVLAPRVGEEMLLPVRCELAARLAGEGLADGPAVLRWMDEHLRAGEEFGLTDRTCDDAGCLRHGVCPPSRRQALAVQLCRALGIPAFLEGGMAYGICPDGAARRLAGVRPEGKLILSTAEGPLIPGEHFSLACWTGEEYRPVALHPLKRKKTIHLPRGAYRLMTARRQIDGSLDVRCRSFLLGEERRETVAMAPDRTGEKLLCRPLPDVKLISLTDTDDTGFSRKSARESGPSLLIWLQPGAEPTEHLLRELLDLAAAVNAGGWPVDLVLSRREELENDTLQAVLAALPGAQCFLAAEDVGYQLRRAMDLGDDRLPLALVTDRQGRGVYACANYSIRTGQTLVKILSMLP